MHIIFSHGKESGPWGSKIKRLARFAETQGFSVSSIDYTDTFDPDARVQRLIEATEQCQEPYLLVGSSMGAYVSLVAAETTHPKGVFLLAPALYLPGYQKQSYHCEAPVTIVHGWSDELIPPENPIRFAKEHQCTLHLIDGDHRLNSSLDLVERLFGVFLGKMSERQSPL